MIQIADLSYCYPGRGTQALDGVSLRVTPGEFALLGGPSGAGKSTLLRSLNGLVPHFSGGTISGAVTVSGKDVIAAGPKAMSESVGFVFQNPEAQSVMDAVEDEVAFGLELAGVAPREMRNRIDDVLNLLQLEDLRHRKVTTLSGGERQRMAIATAMALQPTILALDEPTSQLDPLAAEEVLQALVRLNDRLGLTIILAEQRIERVARHAERLVYLENGRIVIDAPIREGLAALRGDQQPPLVKIAMALGWEPMPLTTKEGLQNARGAGIDLPVRTGGDVEPSKAGRQQEPLVAARNVHFRYNGQPALAGVDINVHAGESVALVGRNGSGKSTLLKCLVGLLRPWRGDVFVGGQPVGERSVAQVSQDVAFLPQNPDDLLFADSVAEELMITLANHGLSPSDLSQPPRSLLAELDLEQVSHRYPRDLSVGQRQRVALAAIMVSRPKMLILDEPTRGLDYRAKRDLMAIWRRWLVRGMGLLLVTHDVEMAAEIADRVVVLSEGRVLADGHPRDVFRATAVFTPQVGRLFPETGWLTVQDALEWLGRNAANDQGRP